MAQYDPSGPWKQLAEGITISAMQQQQPANAGNLTGLLPDSFALRTQTRRAPFINPGVILANLAEMEEVSPLYRFAREAQTGAWINAPCGLVGVEGQVGRQPTFYPARCARDGSIYRACQSPAARSGVTVDGRALPMVNNIEAAATPGWHYDAATRQLVLKLTGHGAVQVRL